MAERGTWRGVRGALVVFAAGFVLAGLLQAWRPPPDHLGGVVLLPVWGAALGLFARLKAPGAGTRTASLAGLVGVATLLNAMWLPPLLASARGTPLVLHRDQTLADRTREHWHPLVSSKALYLSLGQLTRGREVRYVRSPALDLRRLMALAGATRLVELRHPGAWVPPPAEWQRRYPTLSYELDTRGRGGSYQRLVAVTEGADDARWFAVLVLDGTTLAVPDSVWEAERAHTPRGGLR